VPAGRPSAAGVRGAAAHAAAVVERPQQQGVLSGRGRGRAAGGGGSGDARNRHRQQVPAAGREAERGDEGARFGRHAQRRRRVRAAARVPHAHARAAAALPYPAPPPRKPLVAGPQRRLGQLRGGDEGKHGVRRHRGERRRVASVEALGARGGGGAAVAAAAAAASTLCAPHWVRR
jgi:hypothetical protein